MSVPVATVDENNGFPLGKDQVRLTWQTFVVQAEAQPEAVRRRTNDHFGSGILALDCSHDLRALGGCDSVGHG